MLRRDRAGVARHGSSFTYRLGQLSKAAMNFGACKTEDRPHVGRRPPVEKHLTVRRQFVPIAFFGEEALDGEVICQDAHAALGCAATLGEAGTWSCPNPMAVKRSNSTAALERL